MNKHGHSISFVCVLQASLPSWIFDVLETIYYLVSINYLLTTSHSEVFTGQSQTQTLPYNLNLELRTVIKHNDLAAIIRSYNDDVLEEDNDEEVNDDDNDFKAAGTPSGVSLVSA